jgi:hypothetical protein
MDFVPKVGKSPSKPGGKRCLGRSKISLSDDNSQRGFCGSPDKGGDIAGVMLSIGINGQNMGHAQPIGFFRSGHDRSAFTQIPGMAKAARRKSEKRMPDAGRKGRILPAARFIGGEIRAAVVHNQQVWMNGQNGLDDIRQTCRMIIHRYDDKNGKEGRRL